MRNFVLIISFSVICLLHGKLNAQCCEYTVVMNDSYGDGWNGGHLEVIVNGIFLETIAAIDQGSNYIIEVCNGDEIQFEYFGDMYENENTWFLVGGAGNLIASYGPEPTVGLTEIFTVNCDLVADPGTNPCVAIPLSEYDCILADNTVAPGSANNGPCANFNGGDIWYTIPVPESGSILLFTQPGSMNDTGIALWQGEDCNNLEVIGCDDDSGQDYLSLITGYDLEPGSLLYVQLWGYGGQTGTFNFCTEPIETVDLQSSKLPIFLIDTNGQPIPNDEKIDASMQVIYNGPGQINFITDPPNNYDGNIGIELRGATSSGYPQRPYNIETRDEIGTNLNVSLVDMPEENDWVMLSNYNDKSFIRNVLAMHLFERMGNYAPRLTLCEVLLNESYQGVYAFGEKLKRDPNRVDIAKLKPEDNAGDSITGGYILQLNYHNDQNSWLLNYHPIDHPDFDVHMVYEYPKWDVISEPQKQYIAEYVDSMETAIYSSEFDDPNVGFRNYLDIESFIDYFLLNEVSRNNDGFKKSRFFFKDKNSNGGKFKAGPPWDFDWAWKNLYTCSIFENTVGEGWAHLINDCFTDNYSPGWYIRLLQDSTFSSHLRCRYNEYRADFLNMEYIENFVDSISILVAEAQSRHYQKWPFLGIETGSPEVGPLPSSYQGELDFLLDWIEIRLQWLDENLPQQCDGIPEDHSEIGSSDIGVFPNPSNGIFNLNLQPGYKSFIQVYSTDGRRVLERAISGKDGHVTITLSEPGIYFCHISSVTGDKVLKLVVN